MSDVYQAPEASLNEPVADGQYGSVESALAGDYKLEPIEIFKDAWAKLSGMKGTFWGAAVIYYLIAMAFGFLLAAVFGILGMQSESGASTIIAQVVIQVVQTFVLMPIAMGLFMIALKHSVGANIQVGEIFQHFNKAVPLFIAYILMTILTIIGFILLVIPGIYLSVAFAMTMMLIVEKDMSPWEAMTVSRKAITKKWFNMFGFMIVAMIVVVIGMLALLVGLVWAAPLALLAFAMVYRDMFGVEAKTLNG